MLKRMVNTDKDFYKYMGRIFGSREVQRVTSDRFYDDNDKEWIIELEQNTITAIISVKNAVIKNVYAEDPFALVEILKDVYPEVSHGIVTNIYKEVYVTAGYAIDESDGKKKFLTITGGKEVE